MRRDHQFPAHPDPSRPGLTRAVFRVVTVESPVRQQAVLETLRQEIQQARDQGDEVQAAGFYASFDGTAALLFAQYPAGTKAGLGQSVGDIYDLYRGERIDGSTDEAGCVALITMEFDPPEPDTARAFIDSVFTGWEDEVVPGMIGAHFFINQTGSRAFNFAQWTDQDAHKAFMHGGDNDGDEPEPEQPPSASSPGSASWTVRQYYPWSQNGE